MLFVKPRGCVTFGIRSEIKKYGGDTAGNYGTITITKCKTRDAGK
jgi:hypothetical protein